MTSIILDSREASTNPKLERSLRNLKDIDSFKVEQLGAGDILVGTYLIERKTPKDLLTRVDGALHIFPQLDKLVEKRNEGLIPILLIEGIISDAWQYRGIPKMKVIRAQISGLLNSIQLFKYHIPIFKWDTHTQTMSWIQNLAKNAQNPNKVQLKTLRTCPKRKMTMDEKALYLLQGIEGIGPKKSVKILEEFGSIDQLVWDISVWRDDNIISISEEYNRKRLIKIIGEKYFNKFIAVMQHEYQGDE